MNTSYKKIGGFIGRFESKIIEKLKHSKCNRDDDEYRSIVIKLSRLLDFWIVSKLVNTRITPNQITFLSFIFSLFSALFFSLAGHFFVVLGAISFLISHILDGVDGVLARVKGVSSEYGGFLDHISGIFSRPIVFFGIAWGIFSINHNYLTWVFSYLAITSLMVKSYTQFVFLQKFPFSKNISKEIYKKFNFLILFRYTVWFYLPLMLFFSIINNMYFFLLFFGIYGPIDAIFQNYVLIKRINKYCKKKKVYL